MIINTREDNNKQVIVSLTTESSDFKKIARSKRETSRGMIVSLLTSLQETEDNKKRVLELNFNSTTEIDIWIRELEKLKKFWNHQIDRYKED